MRMIEEEQSNSNVEASKVVAMKELSETQKNVLLNQSKP
jgi:hypothetical protein